MKIFIYDLTDSKPWYRSIWLKTTTALHRLVKIPKGTLKKTLDLGVDTASQTDGQKWQPYQALYYTVEPGYNDIGLYDTSPIASDILLYQLIPHC
jgi:hypothetical protein